MKRTASSSKPKFKRTMPIAGRDHVQGPIEAPLTLVEYGDYECPYCGEAHPIVQAIQARLGDRLCFAYRNFPLTQLHPHAEHAAEAAEAAGAQGRFWEMHDLLFENQDSLDDESLGQLASTLGLDAQRLKDEVVSGAHAARVREDYQGGAGAGVGGTPTFFINGELYEGETDEDSLMAALTSRSSV